MQYARVIKLKPLNGISVLPLKPSSQIQFTVRNLRHLLSFYSFLTWRVWKKEECMIV